jgi:hypothetical protein
MQPFWDVFWSDVRALIVFALPMLIISLPISLLAALFGGVNFGVGAWSRVSRSAVRGFVLGTITALVVSMSVEFLLTAEGFPQSRRAIRTAANWQLFLAGPLLVFLFSFMAARRYAPASGQPHRRYSLRQLFVYQLIAAALLGWWTFTRRSEIFERRNLLAWQVRERDAKALFEPLGCWVEAPPDRDEVWLYAHASHRPVSDESLAPVAVHGAVTFVSIRASDVTDAGIKHLRGADRLRMLIVQSDQLTDEGVEVLEDLPRLRTLELDSPHLTGKSLQSLVKVRSLRALTISRAKITDKEIAAFRQARTGLFVRITGDSP